MKKYFLILIFLVILSSLILAKNNICTSEALVCPDGKQYPARGDNCEKLKCPELNTPKFLIEDINQFNYGFYLNNLDEVKHIINNNSDKLPGYLKPFITNEKININFVTIDKKMINLKLGLRNSQVNLLQKGNFDNPNLEIYLIEQDINDIMYADNLRKEIKRKLNAKEITYKTHGFFTSIKIKMLINFL